MGSILFSQNEVENGYYRININSSYANVNKRYYNFSDSDVVYLEPVDEYTYTGFSRLYFVNGKIVRVNPYEKLNPKYDYISLGCYYDTVSPYTMFAKNKAFGTILETADYLDGLTVPNTDVYFKELRYYVKYYEAGWYGEKYYQQATLEDNESNALIDVTDQYREGVRDFTYSPVYRGKDMQFILYDSSVIEVTGTGMAFKETFGSNDNRTAIFKKNERFTITERSGSNIDIKINGKVISKIPQGQSLTLSLSEEFVEIVVVMY